MGRLGRLDRSLALAMLRRGHAGFPATVSFCFADSP
jgi:hypothetical protein